jgi:alpha-amylase
MKVKMIIVVLISCLIFFIKSSTSGVLMQGFYWDVPMGGTWYTLLESKAKELRAVGFTAIWFPSPTKGNSGSYSMGYDVFDHYDLGEYDQKGTIETRFGSKDELKNAVKSYRDLGMDVYVDTVMNHMTGGELEDNPYTNTQTWTKFVYPHHEFEKDYKSFIPDGYNCFEDEYFCGTWGPELCHENSYVGDEFKKWGKWLAEQIGFNGYRLDAVKCISPAYIASWRQAVGGKFIVGEFWDGNRDLLNNFVNQSTIAAFDFPLRYVLRDMCNNTKGTFDMRNLDHAGLAGINPFMAVTFAENHDTDTRDNGEGDPIIYDKMMAYAYILTAEGYPCVFWKDYYNFNLKEKIDPLIWIHEKLASGPTEVIYKDGDLYVAKRDNYIVYINDNPTTGKNAGNIKTPWSNATLKDYTGNVKDTPKTDASGYVTGYQLWAPARSYTVWAPVTNTK